MDVSVVYLPKLCIHNYYHGVSIFEKLEDQICNAQNLRYGEMATLVPHGKHMFWTEYDMAMEIMCAYPSPKYALPHWKCVLRYYAQFPRIDIPSL